MLCQLSVCVHPLVERICRYATALLKQEAGGIILRDYFPVKWTHQCLHLK